MPVESGPRSPYNIKDLRRDAELCLLELCCRYALPERRVEEVDEVHGKVETEIGYSAAHRQSGSGVNHWVVKQACLYEVCLGNPQSRIERLQLTIIQQGDLDRAVLAETILQPRLDRFQSRRRLVDARGPGYFLSRALGHDPRDLGQASHRVHSD